MSSNSSFLISPLAKRFFKIIIELSFFSYLLLLKIKNKTKIITPQNTSIAKL